MFFLSIAHDYLWWHYTRAFGEIFHVWLNFLGFVIQFFSIPQLLRSLLSPWKRMTEERHGSWDFEAVAGFIIINLLSRFLGALMRTTIICIGLLSLVITIIGGFVTYIFWIVAPLAILVLLGLSLTMIIV
ncbi:hypothetical protein KC887_04165 [Candidatus Kaiserbacteria bacterium]|nr:hypothetical protein [Candidatus Kaiserbacteria bacterium]